MKLFKRQIGVITVAILLVGFFWTSLASAQPQPNVFDGGNRWEITFFNDSATDHTQWATQVLCFLPYATVGTSIQGVWYSLSFFDWNGLYYQEGDEVKMTGDYANDVGHDHMTLAHTTWDVPQFIQGMAFKDWTEWREDGSYGRIIGWGNARLVRTGNCPVLTSADAIDKSFSTPKRLTKDGKAEAAAPGDENQESLEDYFRRTGQEAE